MTEERATIACGLGLVAAKLALLGLHPGPVINAISSLSSGALSAVIAFAAWRASKRSRRFARVLWRSVTVASILWALTLFVLAFFSFRANSFAQVMNRFWPATLFSFVIAIVLAVPLLLNENDDERGVDWLPTLDITQLGILSFSAYLVFFYFPLLSGPSNLERIHDFLFLHFTREGFLAAGFFYRGWRSRSRELRRLQFRLSLFFVAFGLIAGFYLTAVDQWHFPVPLADFMNDLPQVILLVLAATWLQREAVTAAVERPRRPREMLWAQVLPVVLPISVLALASRASAEFLHVAWITVGFSFVCYACRLVVMERRQEATLRQISALEDRFYKAFRSNPAAMAISRIADGRYLDVNDRWLDSMHLRREEVIGKTSLELGIWENPADRKELVEAVRATGSFRAKAYKFRAGGRVVTYLVTAERLEVDGDPLLISMGVDLTELQSVTQQLREAQKMELVGSLAGGVAHDFNNLLTVIKGYCELIEMQGLEPETQEEIAQIAEAADKAAALTRQLLAFSRRQVLHPRNIDLNAVVSSIEKLLRRTIGENIELATSFAPGLGTVHADPVQWEQVVINLALNARDAMPQGGQLLFETKNLDLSSPYAERNFEVPAGRYVLLSVSDTGSGIAAENLDHIFEPFFTTKEVGRGTGLGLSTVYGIVKQSGGYIWVYSEPGHGSTFKICLARVDQPAESLPPGGQRTEKLYGEEAILIVEDDASVRDLAVKALGQYGYTAMTAGSGEEALSLARKFGGEIHLLLTDLVMPGMTGEELAQRLKRLRPAIKVVFTSGYAHLAASKKENVNFHEAFLSKPFTPSELARKVREILGPG